MVKVKIYVEGGGSSKMQHIQCREGFSKLINRAGFTDRMPAIVACGGRGAAYKAFVASTYRSSSFYSILLVDSENPIQRTDASIDSIAPWEHLRQCDKWDQPHGTVNDQAQLMVTCMETWIMADREALREFFGQGMHANRLLCETQLETRSRQDVQEALKSATKGCGPRRKYEKGRRSFQVLARLNPTTLKSCLPHFRRFIETLERHCAKPEQ